jgi:hypothetical protein
VSLAVIANRLAPWKGRENTEIGRRREGQLRAARAVVLLAPMSPKSEVEGPRIRADVHSAAIGRSQNQRRRRDC